MVGGDNLTGNLLLKYSHETTGFARMAYGLMLDSIEIDPCVLTRMVDSKPPSDIWKVKTAYDHGEA